jgi:hypothetical protein
MEDLTYFRMDEKWIHQPWYNPDSIFKLIKITPQKMDYFGVDCIWENVQTGFRINQWDKTMRKLTKEELRDYKISQRDYKISQIIC